MQGGVRIDFVDEADQGRVKSPTGDLQQLALERIRVPGVRSDPRYRTWNQPGCDASLLSPGGRA
jgi:hypothetical protein